ncbi:MAG: hypothetical protein HYV09_38900 [Deltaproteobacteria bacterium]|nr:hypothetical protein [Deltaproteobacteria bacterium]
MTSMRSVILVLVVAACAACRSVPPTTTPLAAPAVDARVVGVTGGLESVPRYAVEIELANRGERPCTVTSYRVTWSGGEKQLTPETELVVKPGETIKRTAALGVMPPADADKVRTSGLVTATCATP